MIDLDEVSNEVATRRAVAIERALVASIVKRIGHVPTNAEVAKCGLCQVHRDFTRYLWEGEELFTVREEWGKGGRLSLRFKYA